MEHIFLDDLSFVLAFRKSVPIRPQTQTNIGELWTSFRGMFTFNLPGFRPLTGFERAVIALTTGYVVVRAVRSGHLSKVSSFVQRQIPGWGAFKLLFGIKPTVVLDTDNVICNKKTVLESVRSGSVEVAMTMPRFQVMIGGLEDGVFHVHGNAVRFGNHLVMPSHVYSIAKKLYANGINLVDLSGFEYHDIETDLITIPLKESHFSQLGLKQPAILHEIPEMGLYASIVGPVGKGTTGTVKTDSSCFGRVVYSGTTVAGYSGAAYVVGTSLAGIHQQGGAVNSGFSASYVWTLLSELDKCRLESSEDWLQQSFKQRKRIKIDPKWGGLDEVRVQVGGRYAIVDRSSLNKAFGAEWSNNLNSLNEIVIDNKRVYESSGEPKDSLTPGASSSSDQSQDSLEQIQLSIMNEFNKLSRKQKKSLKPLLFPQNSNTSTQTSQNQQN